MSNELTTAIELTIRVTVLLAVAAGAVAVLHRHSAATKHLVWSASLGSALVLAVLVPWAPRIEVPLMGWHAVGAIVAAPPAMPSPGAAVGSPADVPFRSIMHGEALTVESRLDAIRPKGPRVSLAGTWLMGMAIVLGWALLGRIGLARLARRATRIRDGAWHEIVGRTSAAMGVGKPVVIHLSRDVGAPMTWGTRRPNLMIPQDSLHWSDSLRASVAAHELAHVARRDYAMQLMALLACAVYWFHPGVWMVARRLRKAAEGACDDRVLALGTSGEEYAAHLLGVARASRLLRLSGAVAIGMARPSTLEGRIVAVLDSGCARGEASARVRALVAGVAAGSLVLLGAGQPVPGVNAAPVDVMASVTVNATHATTTPPAAAEAGLQAPVEAVVTLPVEPAPATLQQRDSLIERSVSASRGGTLELDLNAGGKVTVSGWDEPRVSVRALLAGRDWRDVALDVERNGDAVRVSTRIIRGRNTQSFSNEFEIRVPRRFDVRISSGGGGLRLADLEGRFTGHTGGGGFTLERLTGSARLSTGGGTVVVSDSDLSGTVSTGGGMVRLSNVRGGLRGSSGSGPVIYGRAGADRASTSDLSTVEVDRDNAHFDIGPATTYRGGTLHIEKAGGNVNLNAAPSGAQIHTGGGDVTVGAAGGDVSASTGGGDIRIGPAAGSVRAGTGAGEVHVIVDRNGSSDRVIDVSSGKGRVIIDLPRDFSGRLDLETAHTRTHEETARIRSDWDLEREPLTDWDDREGTARRYLRATAVIGRGSGARVVVRTVNGEIEIRRR